jgi:hypothetical protein
MKASIFQDFTNPCEEQDLLSIFETIKSSKFESDINSIRLAYHQENKPHGDELKKKLLSFTPSGTFSYRNADKITEYNQIIHLDFDDLDYKELSNVSEKINACLYTYASFISPSGKGIKVFVKTNATIENHQQVWAEIRTYYHELIGLESDTKCKDVCRLCFFSYDENLYVNVESETFKFMDKLETDNLFTVVNEVSTAPKTLDYCKEFTNKKSEYIQGNRNSYVHLFACNANRFGIPEDETLQFALNEFDLDNSEISASVRSAYKNNIADFAKFANVANNVTNKNELQKEVDSSKDLLYNTPKIPLSVHSSLPNLLKEGSDAFDVHREKDVFLISALAILSGCLPEVQGVYAQRTVYPNLFCFVLAPPASGKGSMQSAKELADVYHNHVLNESKELKLRFDRELREYKRKTSVINKKSNPETETDPPEEPPFKVVYIPANTSSAKLYLHLQHNDEKGIICETEADTLGAVFKNEWGSYSDLLRKGFHHEKVSLSRKTNGEFIDINHPRISVALTGTPNQIFNIIPNAEDGLFSRFIFYAFRSDSGWISPAPDPSKVNLTDHFKVLSDRVFQMVQFLEKHPTRIHLTSDQWNRLNLSFSDYLSEITEFAGEEATSVIKRMGIILYRICMIFTAIRKFENGDCDIDLYCSDDDYDNAHVLVDTFIQHSILMFTNLPSQMEHHAVQKTPKKQQFFDALPPTFQRKEAIEIGLKMGIKERTIDSLLKKWLGKLIQKEDTGKYTKI